VNIHGCSYWVSGSGVADKRLGLNVHVKQPHRHFIPSIGCWFGSWERVCQRQTWYAWMLQFFGVRGRLNLAIVTIWTTTRHSNGSLENASAARIVTASPSGWANS